MVIRSIFLYAFLFLTTLAVNAQVTDSIVVRTDTILNAKPSAGPFKDSTRLAIEAMPKKAILKSAMLPGLGQYYNKGAWWIKVPVIYGGLIGFGVSINYNQSQYKTFLKEAQFRQLNKKPQNPLYTEYQDDGIITIKDGYRRNRDLSILGAVGVYAINVIEAYVDAKFFRFDIDDDLSFNITPSLQKYPQIGHAAFQASPAIKINLAL
ncbi:MAG TPA: DUF5683 domain-containing protein [Sphingobacteriaceae bacterium]|nr:DUF5683 domain-containing protein [Sphingobacteriaceae bacterium]